MSRADQESPMRTFPIAAAAFLAAAAAIAPPAVADDDDVFASPAPTTDIRVLCPSIDESLESGLGALLQRHGEAGQIAVSFELDGRTIRAVQTRGGPQVYRSATRHAIEALACEGNGAGAQTVELQVVFKDPAAR
jgi:hypothetical protein